MFVFEKPVEVPANAKVTFKLVQNHGGWNSDDNQNNNLGRFRLSVTDAPTATADPLYGKADAFAAYRTTVSRVEGREREDRGPVEDPPGRRHAARLHRAQRRTADAPA